MEEYYCPTCKNKLELVTGCGSSSYFCNDCKSLVSRKKILTKDQLEENNQEDKNENL